MSLRLLMCDFIQLHGGDDFGTLKEQRLALMAHVEALLEALPFNSQSDISQVAPLSFIAAFRLAETVLERERNMLEAGTGNERALNECTLMRGLIKSHIGLTARRKIPIKIDF